MDTERMPTPEGPELPQPEPPLDRSKDSAFDRMATDRGGPGWRAAQDPQTREVLAAAQASTLVGEQEAEGLFSLGVRPYLDAPHWLRNGREAGAWAAGVMIALVEGQHTLYARLKPEHMDGAVGALVDAGYAVQRYSESMTGPLDFEPSGWHGPSVTLAVTRTEP